MVPLKGVSRNSDEPEISGAVLRFKSKLLAHREATNARLEQMETSLRTDMATLLADVRASFVADFRASFMADFRDFRASLMEELKPLVAGGNSTRRAPEPVPPDGAVRFASSTPISDPEIEIVHSHLWKARCKQVVLKSTAVTGGVKKRHRSRSGTIASLANCKHSKRKVTFQRFVAEVAQDIKADWRFQSSVVPSLPGVTVSTQSNLNSASDFPVSDITSIPNRSLVNEGCDGMSSVIVAKSGEIDENLGNWKELSFGKSVKGGGKQSDDVVESTPAGVSIKNQMQCPDLCGNGRERYALPLLDEMPKSKVLCIVGKTVTSIRDKGGGVEHGSGVNCEEEDEYIVKSVEKDDQAGHGIVAKYEGRYETRDNLKGESLNNREGADVKAVTGNEKQVWMMSTIALLSGSSMFVSLSTIKNMGTIMPNSAFPLPTKNGYHKPDGTSVKLSDQGLSLCVESVSHLFDDMLQSDWLCNTWQKIVAYMGIRDKGGGLKPEFRENAISAACLDVCEDGGNLAGNKSLCLQVPAKCGQLMQLMIMEIVPDEEDLAEGNAQHDKLSNEREGDAKFGWLLESGIIPTGDKNSMDYFLEALQSIPYSYQDWRASFNWFLAAMIQCGINPIVCVDNILLGDVDESVSLHFVNEMVMKTNIVEKSLRDAISSLHCCMSSVSFIAKWREKWVKVTGGGIQFDIGALSYTGILQKLLTDAFCCTRSLVIWDDGCCTLVLEFNCGLRPGGYLMQSATPVSHKFQGVAAMKVSYNEVTLYQPPLLCVVFNVSERLQWFSKIIMLYEITSASFLCVLVTSWSRAQGYQITAGATALKLCLPYVSAVQSSNYWALVYANWLSIISLKKHQSAQLQNCLRGSFTLISAEDMDNSKFGKILVAILLLKKGERGGSIMAVFALSFGEIGSGCMKKGEVDHLGSYHLGNLRMLVRALYMQQVRLLTYLHLKSEGLRVLVSREVPLPKVSGNLISGCTPQEVLMITFSDKQACRWLLDLQFSMMVLSIYMCGFFQIMIAKVATFAASLFFGLDNCSYQNNYMIAYRKARELVWPGYAVELMKFDTGRAAAILGASKAFVQPKPSGPEFHFIAGSSKRNGKWNSYEAWCCLSCRLPDWYFSYVVLLCWHTMSPTIEAEDKLHNVTFNLKMKLEVKFCLRGMDCYDLILNHTL